MRTAWVAAAVIMGMGWGLAQAAAEESGPGRWGKSVGHRMSGGFHQMPFCPFDASGAELKVTPTKSGVTIEVTASDPTAIARIQKKAQILQLMRELRTLGPEHPETSAEGQDSPQEP